MTSENSLEKVLEDIKYLLDIMPSLSNGSYVIQQFSFPYHGVGQAGFEQLKSNFDEINFSDIFKNDELSKDIKKKKNELEKLEKKIADLSTLFGSSSEENKGTLAYKFVENLEKEISNLSIKRTSIKTDNEKAEEAFVKKIEEIDKKTKESMAAAAKKVSDANEEASRNVKIINQFSDFLSETNKNMNVYTAVIILVILSVGTTVALSIPNLLECFTKYNEFISKLGSKATSWQILNYAFGILIVKLPWALCLSAVFTGMYSLLKGLLNIYEKINQDKRNMSAIYAVSGNVAQALNEYGLSIVEEIDDPETGGVQRVITRTKAEIDRKRETLKWNQIMDYFQRMQSYKEEPVKTEESNHFKVMTDLATKLIDKLPSK